jgi:hypothetical protein
MLVAGLTIVSGRVLVTAGAAQAPNLFVGGVGLMSNGRLAIDTNAPAGSNYTAGIRQSAAGAIYGTTSLDSSGPDVYVGGLRLSQLGQLVYADAASVSFVNGNPITATSALAVNTA